MSRGVKPLMLDANPPAATASHSFLSELHSGERFVGSPGLGREESDKLQAQREHIAQPNCYSEQR